MSISLSYTPVYELCQRKSKKFFNGKQKLPSSILIKSTLFLIPTNSRYKNKESLIIKATGGVADGANMEKYDLNPNDLDEFEIMNNYSKSLNVDKNNFVNKSFMNKEALVMEDIQSSKKIEEEIVIPFVNDKLEEQKLKDEKLKSSEMHSASEVTMSKDDKSSSLTTQSKINESTNENNVVMEDTSESEKIKIENEEAKLLFTDPEVLEYMEVFGLNHEDIKEVPYAHKFIYPRKLKDIKPTMEWLTKDLDISGSALKRVIKRNPSLFTKKLDMMKGKLDWISNTLGIPKTRHGFIISKNMNVVNVSIEKNILPKINFLIDLGISKERVCAMITVFPQFLTLSYQNIEMTVEWLRTYTGMNKSQIAIIISRLPNILSCSIEKKLKANYDFFMSEVKLSHEEMKKLITTLPTILLHKKSTLKSKLDFLVENGWEYKEALERPFYFSMSLDRRLRCRLAYLKEIGCNYKMHTINVLFFTSDENFTKTVAETSLESYLEFQIRFLEKTNKKEKSKSKDSTKQQLNNKLKI